MIIDAPERQYEVLGTLYEGKANTAYLCRIYNSGSEKRYTVNIVSEQRLYRRLVRMFSASEGACTEFFTMDDKLCLVFEYSLQRRFDSFFKADRLSLKGGEDLFLNIVNACIESSLPYPYLYMVITQKRINLYDDGSVSIDYAVDLERISDEFTQVQCTEALLIELMKFYDETDKTSVSRQIITKKYRRSAYSSLAELGSDLALNRMSTKKTALPKRIWMAVKAYSYVIFEVVKVCMVILAVVALITLIMQLTMGDIPYLRLFYNSFETIGDRSMK